MSESRSVSDQPIAVVGLAAMLPGSTDVDGFWRTVVHGHNQITDVPATHWLVEDHYDPDPSAPDKTYASRGGFLPEIEFDPVAFGIPPTTVPATDTAQLLALVVAEQTLVDVLAEHAIDRERTGVILGSAALELQSQMSTRFDRPMWLKALRDSGVGETQAQAICGRIASHVPEIQEATFPGTLSNVVAGRVANRLDLHGINHTVDAACASSLAAISAAVNELRLGRADLMITGGVDASNGVGAFVSFSKTPALSPTGECRPFSADADGTLLGEGVVMIALKRLGDAERDGDHVYAVIRGIGVSSDGHGSAIYAPVAPGQVRALRNAYAEAGYGPDTVGLLEAHGTGTIAGDRVELTALRQVFAETGRGGSQWCALGSVKSQVGHTKAAAGAVGLLKAVLALHHKVLPPTIKVNRPDPALSAANNPFYLNTTARPWIRPDGHPRRASVSSFGFGGTNFHVALEEHRRPGVAEPPRRRAAATELVLFSARSPEDLLATVQTAAPGRRTLSALARESQAAFDTGHTTRLAVIATDLDDLADALSQAATLVAQRPGTAFSDPRGRYYTTGQFAPGRIAFLFPGQGSQYVGMGASAAVHLPAVQGIWDAFDHTGVADYVFPPSAFTAEQRAEQLAELTATQRAQPALAVHSLALLAVLADVNLCPDAVAGHSFGELTALCAAGVFDPATLVRLARARGELMGDAAAPGAMLAVSAGAAEVERAVDGIADVWLANVNSPQQTVLSGTVAAIDAVQGAFAQDGVATHRLNTTTAFHSPLVASAAEHLLTTLTEVGISAPHIPVFGNADAAAYPAEPQEIRNRIAVQLASPVRFADQIEAMYATGVRTFVEVGASATLTGLAGDTLGAREHLAVALDRKGRDGLTTLQTALGQLAVRGVRIDFTALWRHHQPEAAAPEPAMLMKINGANCGRRYPPKGGAAALPPPNPDERERPAHIVPTHTSAGPQPITGAQTGVAANSDDLREIGRRSAEAHATYQRMMTEAHLEFLRFSEAVYTSPAPTTTVIPSPAPLPQPLPPSVAPEPAVPQPAPTTADEDLEQALLAVVAERTGYPASVLREDMDLEADLGIDSIKRIEILGALRQRVGAEINFAQLDPSLLGTARTLREVRELFESQMLGVSSGTPKLIRLVTRTVEAVPSGLAMAGLRDGPLRIVDGGSGVAQPLIAELGKRGIMVTGTAGSAGGGVVFLGGLVDVTSVDEAIGVQREAFQLARTVERRGVFVTVQDTGGDLGLDGRQEVRAWLGGLAALAATVGRESSEVSVKAIDCARAGRDAETLAALIADELTTGGLTPVVGLGADGRRVTPRLEPAELPAPQQCRVGPESVIVATGGGRGVCSSALIELARTCHPRLVLIGRTVLADEPAGLSGATDEPALVRLLTGDLSSPAGLTELTAQARAILAAREIRATIDACTQAGSPVRYVSVDVRDTDALTLALKEVRADWGPITGIVHGAGVIADKTISDKTDEQFDRVFDTKVVGLRALFDATADDPLDLILLFSSVAGYFGNAGQSDYAMANATLDQIAAVEHRNRPGCLVRSLAWGPWDGGMVGETLAEHFQRQGLALIPRGEGARAFVAEIAAVSTPHVVLSAGATLTEPAQRAALSVEVHTHPWLSDHQPAGTPVLPLAAGINWLLGAARARDAAPALLDLRVLRKITVTDRRRLTVKAVETELQLCADGDMPNFRATLALAGPAQTWETPDDLALHPGTSLYDNGVLFHGPWFHAIRSLGALSASGLGGIVIGAHELGWPQEDWHVDVPALDGAFQLAGVWAGQTLGQVLLMGVRECRVYQFGALPGPARCVVQAGNVHNMAAQCDVALLGADGTVWIELLGVELVGVPEETR